MTNPIIELTGHSLTIEDVVNVARKHYQVSLDPAAVTFVQRGAQIVRNWAESDKVIYGINTGFGDLASVVISPENSRILQENLLKSHACGVGDAFPEDIVRAIMLLRVNSLIRGFSGISMAPLAQMVNYLNLGIHPVIPEQGSVGASGDLCPLSHLAITLLGMGEVIYKGQRMPTMEALGITGLDPVELGPKEGLALNNGTAVMTALGSLAIADGRHLAKVADIASSISLEALHGVPYAFDPRTHELRPYLGQRRVASNIRKLISESEIIEKYKFDRVQDAYSLRCIPQVHGASRDALDYVTTKIQIEINSVTDNPLIFPSDMEAISGGNFHGQPIAITMDFYGIAVAEFANISERRVARLVDHKLSGLPPFLVKNSGLNSGFMIPQYTCAALVSENKVLSHPSSVDSIPTSANQEDHVSMGAYSSRKARTLLDNAFKVIAIELFTSCQALDFSNPLKPGKGVRVAREFVRTKIPFIEEDQYLHPHIISALSIAREESLVNIVEDEAGVLF
ncbi:MAG TPA: histidine ammonia-lyase [Synergistales bacterium]|nr:histidine ammonia-lyase [Synergistales bacterium]